MLELGFTLLFIVKKWSEGKLENPPELKDRIEKLTDRVINSEVESYTIRNLVTFFKDFVLGFVYLFTSSFCVVMVETLARVDFRDEDFVWSKENTEFQYEALNFFNKYTGVIEIVRNESTELVYYPILPFAESLQNEQKTEWLRSLPVGKPRAKIDCFMDNSLDYIQQVNNEYMFTNIFRYYVIFGAITKQIPLFKSFAFYLSILLNLVIIASYRKHGNDWDTRLEDPSLFDYFSTSTTNTIINVFAGVLTISYFIILTAFLYKHILSTYNRLILGWSEENTGICKGSFNFFTLFIVAVLSKMEMYMHIANLAMGFLGWFLHPLFFTFHLLTDAFRFERLLSVLKAIVEPAVGILLTLMLYIVLEYLFSVIGYLAFMDDYEEYTCDSVLHCFMFNIDMTFKENGGIGAALIPSYTIHEKSEYVTIKYSRVVYDFLFALIMTMIIVQLLSGLIIDKFKSLRDESEKIEEDMRASCLICSETAETIERRSGKTFDDHFNNVHNPWFYLMFIAYLNRKPRVDLSGIESYVYENFKNKKILWLPYSL